MEQSRLNILNLLIHRVNSFSEGYRQNIALLGEPSAGKTTLLKNLLDSNEIKKDAIIPIYIEIKLEPFEFCVKRFIKAAIFQLVYSDPRSSVSYEKVILLEDLKRGHPKTADICARVLQDVERGRFDEAYSFMLDITSSIFEESGKRCVLIIDEFHNLENYTLKHPFGTLAKKIMLQKDTMYILLSSMGTISQRLLSEKLYLLFGNFERITLPAFDINTSRLFLQENIQGIRFPQVYLDFLGAFTGNKLFYLKGMAEEMDRIVFTKKVPQDDFSGIVMEAMSKALFKKSGIINQHFFNYFYKLSEGRLLSKLSAVLIALSSDNRKQNEIAESSKLQARDVSKILHRLIELDIIVRHGSLLRFRDKLFSFWIRNVYLKRLMSFSIDEHVEEECFRKEVHNELECFIHEFEKDLSTRVMELFRLFKNDVIQLNGRQHRFQPFADIQKLEENFCNSTNILAASGNRRWLCTIKKERVTENDLAELMKCTKERMKDVKVNRNILITLTGIEENAYLIAKESRYWVWDLECLNVLMELYGKPHVA